jgi:hypothetical protein
MTAFATVWRPFAEIPPQEDLPRDARVILANECRIDLGVFDDQTRRWTWCYQIKEDGPWSEPAVFTLIDFPKFPMAKT